MYLFMYVRITYLCMYVSKPLLLLFLLVCAHCSEFFFAKYNVIAKPQEGASNSPAVTSLCTLSEGLPGSGVRGMIRGTMG